MHIPKSALAAVCALAPVAEKVEVAERTPSHSVAQPGRRDENAVDDAHDERPESHAPPTAIEVRPADVTGQANIIESPDGIFATFIVSDPASSSHTPPSE